MNEDRKYSQTGTERKLQGRSISSIMSILRQYDISDLFLLLTENWSS